jgi:phosphoglycerate dehydrogenase-like enzyme
MLAVRRGLVQADKDVRSGTWEKYGYMSSEITGQTMGVLGYGAIGRLVLDLAQGLDMNAIAFDPYVDDGALGEGVEPVETVLELFEQADAVGVHAPLTDETRGIVGEEELRALGSDGIIVNAARGGLIQEDALVDALRNEVIWGAGIDVFVEEPAPDDHPLFELDNVIVSPHMAGSTKVSVPAKDKGGAENVRMMYNEQLPPTTVNRDELVMYRAFGAEEVPEADAF